MAGLDAPTLILTILSFVSWLIAMAGTGERACRQGCRRLLPK